MAGCCIAAVAFSLSHPLSKAPFFSERLPAWRHCERKYKCNAGVQVIPPPPDFDMRLETAHETCFIVKEMFPELSGLAENGEIVAVKRPVDYVERRTDGYVEPELVILLGTSHVSRDSAANVERVLRAVRPENVVVELCRSRVGIMYSTNSAHSIKGRPEGKEMNLFSLGGESFLGAMGRSLDLGGQSALALRLLLAGFSQKMSPSIGTAIGVEFCAARKISEEIGAQIVLGDRRIEITLERAWKSLKWMEKVRLVSTLIQGIFFLPSGFPKGNIKEMKTDDELSTMFRELSLCYPSLLQPLIHERDVYLAWSLKRSKAVNGSKVVVGIIGRGHMRGVVHSLKYNQDHLRFRDLVGGKRAIDSKRKDWMKGILWAFIRDTIITVILLWFFEHKIN